MRTQEEFDAKDAQRKEWARQAKDTWKNNMRERQERLDAIATQPADVQAAIKRWIGALPPFVVKTTHELVRPVENPYAPYADQRVERGEAWFHRPTIPAEWRVTIERDWSNVWRPGADDVKYFLRDFEEAKRDVAKMAMTASVKVRIAGIERLMWWEHRYLNQETVELEFRGVSTDERGRPYVRSEGLRKREREAILAERQLALNILAALSPECDDLDALQRNRGLGNGTVSLARKLMAMRKVTLADIKAALDYDGDGEDE